MDIRLLMKVWKQMMEKSRLLLICLAQQTFLVWKYCVVLSSTWPNSCLAYLQLLNHAELSHAKTHHGHAMYLDQEVWESIYWRQEQLDGTPVLVYFNPDLELILQTNISKDGLGAVLHLPQHKENGLRLKRRSYLSYLDSKISSVYLRVIVNDHKPLEAFLSKPQKKRFSVNLYQPLLFDCRILWWN